MNKDLNNISKLIYLNDIYKYKKLLIQKQF